MTVADPIQTILSEDMFEERSTPWVLVAGIAVLVAAIVGVWVFFARSGTEPVANEPAAEGGTVTTELVEPAAAATTTTLTRVDLVPFETDPVILTMPRTLPGGMGLCEDDSVTLCDPDDPSRTITITLFEEMLRDTSSAGAEGIRRLPGDDLAMAIAFRGSALIYEAEGIPPYQLVSIVSSVPLSSSAQITVPEETRLTEELSRGFIAELAGVPEALVEDTGTAGIIHWNVNLEGVFFGYGELLEPWETTRVVGEMREWAASLRTPTSASEDRTLIVGFSPATKEYGAQWIQRDTFWFFYMNEELISADEFIDRVNDLEAAIADHQ